MERVSEKLDSSWKKISDGACHAQVRGGSGLGRFIAADVQPDKTDETYLQLREIDWPGPEALYVSEEGEAGSVIVWRNV